jgi:hypothetical protein
MKQVVLNIKEGKYGFFMELVKSLDFVQIIDEDEADSKEDIVTNLTLAFKDLKNYKEGNLKTTSAKEFLNEL